MELKCPLTSWDQCTHSLQQHFSETQNVQLQIIQESFETLRCWMVMHVQRWPQALLEPKWRVISTQGGSARMHCILCKARQGCASAKAVAVSARQSKAVQGCARLHKAVQVQGSARQSAVDEFEFVESVAGQLTRKVGPFRPQRRYGFYVTRAQNQEADASRVDKIPVRREVQY
mgnify:CR=1 FL=1